MVYVYKVSGDGELERWMASCGRILLFVRGVGSGDDSYLWEVQYQGLVVSVFRGVGRDLCVYAHIVCGYIWLSQEPVIYGCYR